MDLPLTQIFNIYDADKDGYLSPLEVNTMFMTFGSQLRVQDRIGLAQFITLVTVEIDFESCFFGPSNLKDIIMSFLHLDFDADGCISINDIIESMRSVGVSLNSREASVIHTKLATPTLKACIPFSDYVEAIKV